MTLLPKNSGRDFGPRFASGVQVDFVAFFLRNSRYLLHKTPKASTFSLLQSFCFPRLRTS